MTPALPAQLTTAIVVPIIVLAAAWLAVSIPRWRRISWREQVDTPLNLLPKEARMGGMGAAWKVLVNHREVARPSLVLLRVRNAGVMAISQAGVRRPITFTFPGRDVVEYAVTDCRGVTWDTIAPPSGADGSVVGNRIILPRFPMGQRASFKLLVLLSGTGEGVLGKGRLRGGRVARETRRGSPRVRNLAFGTALALLIGTQAGVALGEGPPVPASCASGQLVIQGSTAFAPTAMQIAQAYSGSCRAAGISVTGTASINGLDALGAAGMQRAAFAGPATSGGASSSAGSAGTSPAAAVQIAMSDGKAPAGFGGLVAHPVGVIIFAVVVNRHADVFNLSTRQLRGIFSGSITNWRQVGGANLPVSIVGRASGSGTRHTFESKVLGGIEPQASSFDCVHKNEMATSRVILCEAPDTTTLLQRVNSLAGAVGYAQISDAAPYANVDRVKINASDPDLGAVEQGEYPYWTVEYLYTYGTPRARTLTAAFLAYMGTETASTILVGAAYTPCAGRPQPSVLALCGT